MLPSLTARGVSVQLRLDGEVTDAVVAGGKPCRECLVQIVRDKVIKGAESAAVPGGL